MQSTHNPSEGKPIDQPTNNIRTLSSKLKLNQRMIQQLQSRLPVDQRNDVEIKIDISVRQHLSKSENDFVAIYKTIPNPNNASIKKRERNKYLKKILPHIEILKTCIEQLTKPSAHKDLGKTECNRLVGVYHNKIGLAYMACYEFGEARSAFLSSLQVGTIEGATNLLANAEIATDQDETQHKHLLIEACEITLAQAEKFNITAEHRCYPTMERALYIACTHYVFEAKELSTAEQLAKKAKRFLTIPSCSLLLDKTAAEADKAMYWRQELIKLYAKSQGDYSAIGLTKSYFVTQANIISTDLYSREKFIEFTVFIHGNRHWLDQELINKSAAILLQNHTEMTPAIIKQAKNWLLEAAMKGDDQSINFYLGACYALPCDDIFIKEDNDKVIAIALNKPNCKATAHFALGKYYDFAKPTEQSDAKAFYHYMEAAKLNHPMALQDVGAMYNGGQHVAADPVEAIKWFKRSLEAGNSEAFPIYAITLISLSMGKAEEQLPEIENAVMLTEKLIVEEGLPKNFKDTIQSNIFLIKGFVAYIKLTKAANCSDWPAGKIKAQDAFQNAIKIGSADIKVRCYLYLAWLHLNESFPEQDLKIAETHLKTAMRIINKNNEIAIFKEFVQAELSDLYMTKIRAATEPKEILSIMAKFMALLQTDSKDKKRLEALFETYFSNFDSETPIEIKQEDTKPKSANIMKTDMEYKKEIFDAAKAIDTIGNVKSPRSKQQHIEEIANITKNLEKLGNNFSEIKKHFYNMTCTFDKALKHHAYQARELITLLNHINSWRITDAINPFVPLLLAIDPKSLSSSELSDICYLIATTGFSKSDLRQLANHFLKIWTNDINDLRESVKSLSANNRACLFSAIAILDASLNLEQSPMIATIIYEEINNNKFINTFSAISRVYHALKYFENRYPSNDWKYNIALGRRLDIYEAALQEENAVNASKSQTLIYELLHQLDYTVEHEAFIAKAGRRVDFLKQKHVIQFNGTWQHYLYHVNGTISHASTKDLLCHATLQSAGYSVTTINKEEWESLRTQEAVTNFLKSKLSCIIAPSQSGLFSKIQSNTITQSNSSSLSPTNQR